MFKRKAIVSLNTFTLLLILYLLIFIASYSFYHESKQDSELKLKELECLNSALSFRSEIIQILKYPNSTLIYINNYKNDNILIKITNTSITSKQELNFAVAEINISTLGINFCSQYNFTESENILISYNGSCVFITN